MIMSGNRTMPLMAEEKSLTETAVPEGGLNLSLQSDHIGDNESPDMLNMWWRDGMLKLRPGLQKKIEHSYGTVIDIYPRDGQSLLLRKVTNSGALAEEKYGFYIATKNTVLSYDGENLERIPNAMTYNGSWVSSYPDYNFEKCVFIPSGNEQNSAEISENLSWAATGDVVYLIGDGYFLKIAPQVVVYDYPMNKANVTAACFIGPVNPYVPVIETDCNSSGEGTKAEERNLLTPFCIQKFTTNATDKVYHLNDTEIDNALVTVVYTVGSSIYKFSFDKDYVICSQVSVVATLDREQGTITFSKVLIDAASSGVKNNLTVTYGKTIFSEIPVSCCMFGTWFDSCLFLSGYDKKQNRVYYSAANDPLYFKESAYMDIENPSKPVTAFGIQSNNLVIFKCNGLYTIDSTSDEADYTYKEVNSTIGCDMPKTVNLAGNILVWANTSGGVFALKTTSTKSEWEVRLLSQNINSNLLCNDILNMQKANAVADGTHYYLLIGENLYILDYSSMYLSSVTEKLNITWHLWSIPFEVNNLFFLNSKLAASSLDDGCIYIFNEEKADDGGVFFEAYWFSRNIDFGAAHKLKKLYRSIITLDFDGILKIQSCCRDSSGQSRKTFIIERASEGEKTITYNTPSAWSRISSVGIRRCKGDLNSFSIKGFTALAACGSELY